MGPRIAHVMAFTRLRSDLDGDDGCIMIARRVDIFVLRRYPPLRWFGVAMEPMK